MHITNTEISRVGVTPPTTSTSASNTAASSSFSLSDFENELASLVNSALQAAGVSPSEATFSFNPTSSTSTASSSSSADTASASDASSGNTTSSSSATASSTQSQTNGTSGNGQTSTTADWINMPMIGEVNVNAAAPTTPAMPAPTTVTATGQTVDMTDSTAPVVGTEGLVYDPKTGTFGGMGAAAITDNQTLVNPITGKTVSADLVLDGYEKIYGSDTTSLQGALLQNWGPSGVQAYLQANPSVAPATTQQMSQQSQSNFELYGPWTSFTDPSSGVLSYFDANGTQYANGTGPASEMFTAVGTPNTTAWDSATAL